jgi:hypothetical protein
MKRGPGRPAQLRHRAIAGMVQAWERSNPRPRPRGSAKAAYERIGKKLLPRERWTRLLANDDDLYREVKRIAKRHAHDPVRFHEMSLNISNSVEGWSNPLAVKWTPGGAPRRRN